MPGLLEGFWNIVGEGWVACEGWDGWDRLANVVLQPSGTWAKRGSEHGEKGRKDSDAKCGANKQTRMLGARDEAESYEEMNCDETDYAPYRSVPPRHRLLC